MKNCFQISNIFVNDILAIAFSVGITTNSHLLLHFVISYQKLLTLTMVNIESDYKYKCEGAILL